MISGGQRIGNRAAFRARGSSGDSPNPAVVDLAILQLRGFDPSQPIGFNRPSSFMFRTHIPLDDGTMQKDVPTSQPYDIKDPAQRLRAITEAGRTLRKPGQLIVNRTMAIQGLPSSINLATKGSGLANINSANGGNVLAHGFVNFGRGVRNTNVTMDTYDHHRMNVMGSIRLRLRGNVNMNDSYMPGAITVVSGDASMAGVRGNPTINRVRLSSISHAAVRHATDEAFSGPMEYFGSPRTASIQHAAASRDLRLTVPHQVFQPLAANYVEQLKAQMRMQYSHGSVRSRKQELDGLAHPHMA